MCTCGSFFAVIYLGDRFVEGGRKGGFLWGNHSLILHARPTDEKEEKKREIKTKEGKEKKKAGNSSSRDFEAQESFS